jgi:hypothetical protein
MPHTNEKHEAGHIHTTVWHMKVSDWKQDSEFILSISDSLEPRRVENVETRSSIAIDDADYH